MSERNLTAKLLGRILLDDLELRSAPAHSLAPVTEWDRRVVIANMDLLAAQVLCGGLRCGPESR